MKNALMLCTAALALGASMAAAEEVRVYNWSDYIDEALLEKFEQETGLELVYDVFDSNEVLETKMLAGGSGYDVVVPTGTFLQAGAESSCAEGTACRPSQLSAWTLPVAVPICGATESPIALSSRVPNERRAATVLTSMPGARHHGVMSLVPGSCGPGGPRGTVPAGPFFLTPALGSACAAVRKASCAKVT